MSGPPYPLNRLLLDFHVRDGPPLPNLADLIQEKCEKLLEQVCMPVQG
jgi:hypothetical protein